MATQTTCQQVTWDPALNNTQESTLPQSSVNQQLVTNPLSQAIQEPATTIDALSRPTPSNAPRVLPCSALAFFATAWSMPMQASHPDES